MVSLLILILLQPIISQYVTTIAGSVAGYADGQTNAKFNSPLGVAVDINGNIFLSDSANERIRKVNSSGYVSTIAGSGAANARDGQGTSASFSNPNGLTIDSHNNLYVVDTDNQLIRKVDPNGLVSTLAGIGLVGSDDAVADAAFFNYPCGIAIALNGKVFIADQGNHRIRIIAFGNVNTVAGSSQGYVDGMTARFNNPTGVAVDLLGNLYVVDYENHVIRKVNVTGYTSTLVGSGTPSYVDGQGVNAMFSHPRDISIDSIGNLYISDYGNHKIRRVNLTGHVSTVAGTIGGYADGLVAKFYYPAGIAIDSSGNLYVADYGNNMIRKISMTANSVGSTTGGLSNQFTSIASNQLTSISIPSITTLPSSTSLLTRPQTDQSPFYLKAEFMYSAFVAFFTISLLIIVFMNTRRTVILIRRRIVPPSGMFNQMQTYHR